MHRITLLSISILLGLQCQTGGRSNSTIAYQGPPGDSAFTGQADQNDADSQNKENPRIGEYIVELFEDRHGHLWIGTLSKGVARYDGKSLRFFTTEDGLASNAVVDIEEDADGILWMATRNGLARYDGETFTSYMTEDGLCPGIISNLLIDQHGVLWIGTWEGVCRFNGQDFMPFYIPTPEVEHLPYHTTQSWITALAEDDQGNIWIGRDGYGATRWDGKTFQHLTKSQGLPANHVQSIMPDAAGNIWVTTRVGENDHPDPEMRKGPGGLAKLDAAANTDLSTASMQTFANIAGLHHNQIYGLYQDRQGSIWIGATGHGVYRCGKGQWQLFNQTNRPDLVPSLGIPVIQEDKQGRMWFGMAGGLFRLEGDTMIHVGHQGPWE